ncbi:putative serine protease 45 isoform X1 [Balaenoptera ricei]|uniref:putative serine protease 45 isoform X1 n=1 Tax=Balaenoptera ricei TaxID=2746895 RepID=UPI0028BDCDEF|nr:putative serine protease 45 isoform X1 [Balaenoptera ricei]XP_059795426.1 putative serine protease 45 isoform X1 [Balaenoptera ricei]XP_059795427.1 putative serine protease 45 isoform X1 [Balaenoptera ricei]XP_059795428.1 putative serine protease 45 isoform X1 [Balaenoptera ricei]XP_059795429.1 putative serine protease 45 isoform X1 [Balaenoptera ricei]XP_059795430.1 putative serine protease 45 isoform X1 [Balaenoptera ricei]
MKLSNAGSPGKQGYDQRLGDKVPTPVQGFGCAFTGQVLGDSHPLKALGGTSTGLATAEAMTGPGLCSHLQGTRTRWGYKGDNTKPACGKPWWPKNLDVTRYWPWDVSLRVENEHVCGGALIDLDWVVTAAHCIQGTKEYSVILRTSKLKPTDSTRALSIPVRDIIMHPKYWGRNFITGDVALLQLHTPVVVSKYVQPICLPEPNYNLKVGTQCWVTGWGQVKQRFSANSTLTPELREAEVFIMDNKMCDRIYRKKSLIPRVVPLVLGDMICATNYGENLCYGNSGSSLVCQVNHTWIRMGVLSWSFSCSRHHFPGIYTSTSYFTDWIKKQISDMSALGQGPTVITRLEGRWNRLEIPDASPRGWAFISPGRGGSGLPEEEVQEPAEVRLRDSRKLLGQADWETRGPRRAEAWPEARQS